jgi:hypothetical protein
MAQVSNFDRTGPVSSLLQTTWTSRRSYDIGRSSAAQRRGAIATPDDGGDVVRRGLKLVGSFETERQARFAASWLKSLSHLDVIGTKIVPPRTTGALDDDAARGILPDTSWRQIREVVPENYTILIVTVDECDSHETQAVLDEDVGSLTTMVFPQSAASML